MIGQWTGDPPGPEIGWVLLAACAFMLGVLAGLIGLVSMAIRGSRAPVAGAIVAVCGVVIIISMVAFGIETGGMPSGEWLGVAVWGGLFVTIGLCLSFLKNRPPSSAQPLPGMCGESTPQGRRCGLPPGHEGSHRYVTPARAPPSVEGA